MTYEDINLRIKRIYSAINAAVEEDLDSFEPTVTRDANVIRITQDFQGNLTQEELANLAYSSIHNIANLYGNLKKWASNNKKNPSKVDEVFNTSREIKIIQDLSNNDKHGYPPRNGGHSGISPKMEKFSRGLQIATPSKEGGTMEFTLDLSGKQQTTKMDNLAVVVSGSVSDANGNHIGNSHLIAMKALEAWEVYLNDNDIKL